MRIRNFKALRPSEAEAPVLSAPPYDVVSTEEAREMAKGNPLSLFRVSRAEIEFAPGQDPHADCVYAKAVENFKKLVATGHLKADDKPGLYLYEQQMGAHRQFGGRAVGGEEPPRADQGPGAVVDQNLGVAARGGSAPKAEIPGFEVAGKTGTSQKIENGHYSHTKHVATFTGFFPASDPKIAVTVVIDDGKRPDGGICYGGIVAAPAFKEIAQQIIQYMAMEPPKPSKNGMYADTRANQ